MELQRIVRIKTRVALVAALRDSFSSGPPFDRDISVRLDGFPRRPIGKPDGTYVFTDLEPGTYRLEIASTYYFRETRIVSVGTANTIVPISLAPVPSYPYPPSGTLLRAMTADRAGRPVQHAFVTAAMVSEPCAAGRISEDGAKEESDEIAVSSPVGPIGSGDRFMLVERGSGERREMVRIREVLEYRKRFRLENGLSFSYSRGSLLYPVVATRTTERGELAIAFPPGKTRTFAIELRLERATGEASVRDVTVEEGTTVNMGTWNV